MTATNLQQGFSAIELMISLFIAVAFIATGYQLYSVIIKDSAAANQRTIASNVAYSHLRQLSDATTGLCVNGYTFSPVPALTIAEKAQLPESAVMTTSVTCPFGTASSVWNVQVAIAYGSPTQEVVHALYISQ
ncbi:MAG: prepilin-type N-terminal cleavage/methylation domain-containing protein [Candidatus Saccharimonadales bacterium]